MLKQTNNNNKNNQCDWFRFVFPVNYQHRAAGYVWQGGVWAVGPSRRWIKSHDIWLFQWCQVSTWHRWCNKRIQTGVNPVFWVVCCCCYRPGPSSPLPWVRDCVLQLAPNSQWREKILLGFNLYGLDFASQGTEPVLGTRWAETLAIAAIL